MTIPTGPGQPADRARGAFTAFSPRQRWLLLAGFALLVILRLPQVWAHGRFLDEEATVFLAYAWHYPWHDALVRPFAGYWNMAASATTVLTVALVKDGIVALERAPYLTMTLALAVQLLPAALILTGRAAWLARRPAVIAALLIIGIAPVTEEVFFNVLHIQFHLALATALILALDVPGRRLVRAGYQLVLFVTPLCGPGGVVMLPLLGLRALVDRDWRRLWQAAALAAGAAVQLLVFYGTNPMRGHLLDPGTIAATLFVRLIALPVLSFGKADRLGAAIHVSQSTGGTGWWWAAAGAVLLFALLIVVAARRRDAALWLVLSGLAVAAASFGFGMVITTRADLFSVGAGERYNFLPLVTLTLALIVLSTRPGSRARPFWALLCLLVLFTGATRYPKPLPLYRDGPSWPAEVAAWRRDHRHPLAVWPRPYTADLSDAARRCSAIGPDVIRSTDPRYCESGWVAAFYRQRRAMDGAVTGPGDVAGGR